MYDILKLKLPNNSYVIHKYTTISLITFTENIYIFTLFYDYNQSKNVLLNNIILNYIFHIQLITKYLQGFYTGSGMDMSIYKDTNFPQQLIYGTYKLRVSYTRNNEIFGCNIYIYEVRRL